MDHSAETNVEFEKEYEENIVNKTRAELASIDEKARRGKSHATVPLRRLLWFNVIRNVFLRSRVRKKY